MIDAALLVLFPLLMAFAAASDLVTMTIPNRVSALLAAGFAALALALGMPVAEALNHFGAAGLVLAIGFVMFGLGWVGGGDAKLAAATALWLGWGALFDYALVAALLGGLLTLALLQARKAPLPGALAGLPFVARLHHPATGVPYGIALAGAGLLLYPGTDLWRLAAGA